QRADDVIADRRADKLELARVKLDTGLAKHLTEKESADEVADGETVRLGDFEDMISGDQATSAGHVLDYDTGLAGDVFTQVAGDGSVIGVKTPASREAYYDANRFASIKIFGSACLAYG